MRRLTHMQLWLTLRWSVGPQEWYALAWRVLGRGGLSRVAEHQAPTCLHCGRVFWMGGCTSAWCHQQGGWLFEPPSFLTQLTQHALR